MGLRQRGFDLIEFNDSVEFRYAYESTYRSVWDRGGHTDLVVVLRLQNEELESLPYDLLQAGRRLSFNLGAIFPNLSYPVVEELDRNFLDALFEAQQKYPPDRMGDNSTRDFILRHVFGIAAELIANEVDLLRSLLRLHYKKSHIPQSIADRLIYVLKGHGGFQAWPLVEIVSDDDAFFTFLQERWPVFLGHLGKEDLVSEAAPNYGLKYSGPDLLPFDHQDIKVYIDNLFVEGKLAPIKPPEILVDADSWVRIGIAEAGVDDERRITRLFEHIGKDLPTEASSYSDWTAFALKWAELSALIHCDSAGVHQPHLREMGDVLNATFAEWLCAHYASLMNLPPSRPAMVHHVPRRLARDMEGSEDRRVALIVVDGMALDQWITIRQILQKQDANLVMRESAVFAWIPTITSVSRQAIFSGKAPFYFPSTIQSTNSDGKLWKQFWEGNGLSRLDVAYQRGLSGGEVESVLDTSVNPDTTRVVGLVVDMVDKIMHGMQNGSVGMHSEIKLWCQKGFLVKLVGYLLKNNYEVWMTSDHGNIECQGKGRPSEGAIADTRGERVRVYPTPELRSQVADNFNFAHELSPVGLPPDYFPLIAGGRHAFVSPKESESIVGHGGVAIEEVIVPLVKFERKTP